MTYPLTEPVGGFDPGIRPEGEYCVNVTLFENLRRLAVHAEPVPELRDPRIPWRVRADAWIARADRLLGADR